MRGLILKQLRMKFRLALYLSLFLFGGCQRKVAHQETPEQNKYLGAANNAGALRFKGKLNITNVGVDGIPYCISMADTIPSLPYRIPHLLLYQGDPLYLHSIVSLENTSRTGDDSLNAIIGVVDNRGDRKDNRGNTTNVLRATPNQIAIQTILDGDTSGGAYYGFTKNGIDCRRGNGNQFGRSFVLTNHPGLAGQVLTINQTGDTALWANGTGLPSVTQKYFAPANGQAISVLKSAYNIINPVAGLLSLAINLPAYPTDNDWFEVTFTEPVKAITYKGGKVAGNAIKAASSTNNYKKFVFRKADLTWY